METGFTPGFEKTFDTYNGRHLQEYPSGYQEKVLAAIYDSVNSMIPAPTEIGTGELGVYAYWKFPTPIPIMTPEDMETVYANVTRFIDSNLISSGSEQLVVDLIDGILNDEERRAIEFYKLTGLCTTFEAKK